MSIDRSIGRRKVTSSPGLNLKDHDRGAVPGHQIEVPAQPLRSPSTRHNRVTQAAQMEVSGVFTPLSGQQMRRFQALAVGKRTQRSIGAAFHRERKRGETHQRFHRLPKTSAARKTLASSVERIVFQRANAASALTTALFTAVCDSFKVVS